MRKSIPVLRAIPCFLVAVALNLPSAASGDDAAITISIAVPQYDRGEKGIEPRTISVYDRSSHFHVLITNVSDKQQRIMTDHNSWGEQALSFEWTGANGEKHLAHRPVRPWRTNVASWWVLQPDEGVVLDVHVGDGMKWIGFPHPPQYGASETVTMRAIFELKLDGRDAGDYWTGRVASRPDTYAFVNVMPAGVGKEAIRNLPNR